jgi:outer membrane protein
LQQRQQELEIKKQNDGSQLIKEQEKFNKKLQEDIRGFLEEFADEKGYDFVLAYTKTSTILFANPDLDITQEVIEALNSGKSYGKKNDKESDEKTTTDTVTKKSELK